jgi:Uncharacterized conserved protein (COG2071)
MTVRAVECTIQRRLLVNYRIEPEFVARLLPWPFRPQLLSGMAVGGVCFIRLSGLRAGRLPRVPALVTENAAHRFAVEWDDASGTRVGVYVPRRDTNSKITSAAGGKIFPGSYRLARFIVQEPGDQVRITVSSRDGQVRLSVAAAPAPALDSALFGTADDAAAFFRQGALGWSPAQADGCLDGVRLHSATWTVRPMIAQIRSSLFDDPARFPPGTCVLDSAFLMRNLTARWATDRAATPGQADMTASRALT